MVIFCGGERHGEHDAIGDPLSEVNSSPDDFIRGFDTGDEHSTHYVFRKEASGKGAMVLTDLESKAKTR